jgi:hypothetical protein
MARSASRKGRGLGLNENFDSEASPWLQWPFDHGCPYRLTSQACVRHFGMAVPVQLE